MTEIEADELMRTKVVINISNVLHQVQTNYHTCPFKKDVEIKLLDLLQWLDEKAAAPPETK